MIVTKNNKGVKSVKFPACYYVPAINGNAIQRTHIAEFRVGDGPCGKHVTYLDVVRVPVGNVSLLRITQMHDDGTLKTFEYDYQHILGRVEIEQL